MITFSFINLKGGTGKSTIAQNTAYRMAQHFGFKVLFIDNDKQANSSRLLEANFEKTFADLLLGKQNIKYVIQKTRYENLDLISSDMQLQNANLSILQDQDREQSFILKNALATVKDQYDFCIIDNPPDINISVFNALLATDEVIVVTNPDEDAMDGVDEIINQIESAGKYNSNLQFRGCLMNKFLPTRISYEYKDDLKYPFFRTHIPFVTKVTMDKIIRARVARKPILEFSPYCSISKGITQFVNELLYVK